MRCYHPVITGIFLRFLGQLFQFFDDDGAIGHPEYQPRPHIIIHRVNTKLFTQLAVIPFFGFFEHRQVFIEFFLLWKRDTVYPGELFVLFIALPVGARYAGKFDGFDGAGSWYMRPAAEVGEITLGIERYISVFEIL